MGHFLILPETPFLTGEAWTNAVQVNPAGLEGRKPVTKGCKPFQQGHFQRNLEIKVGRDICPNRDGVTVHERKLGTL